MSALWKLRRGVTGRIGLTSRIRERLSGEPSLWFHVASSGELEQCFPIMEAIRESRPQEQMFLSYFSPSAEQGILHEAKRRSEVGVALPWSVADYAPFDWPSSVGRFLDLVRPRAAAFIHREIWPGMVRGCCKRGIPMSLFAAHFPPSSQKRWAYYGRLLSQFRFIGTTDEESAIFLGEKLPGVRVERVGDPRIERVLSRKAWRKSPPWSAFFERQKVLMLSSVWPKDFAALAPALTEILRSRGEWRIVVVPHEPHAGFIRDISSWFEEQGLHARRWSHWLEAPDSISPLIVDGVGFLAELYHVASLVFVGGSFGFQVHNVLEPAAYGRPILTGPLIHNSVEALELSRNRWGLTAVKDAEELKSSLLALMASDRAREEQHRSLLRYLDARRGSGRRYADILLGE